MSTFLPLICLSVYSKCLYLFPFTLAYVEGRVGCFYLISFQLMENTQIEILLFANYNGPRSLYNSLLLVDRWFLNLMLQELKVSSFLLWARWETLTLGNTALEYGNVLYSSTLNFYHVRFMIDSRLPLLQRVNVPLSNDDDV